VPDRGGDTVLALLVGVVAVCVVVLVVVGVIVASA
jgi:hypothetical protein